MTRSRSLLVLLFIAFGALACADGADPPSGSAAPPSRSASSGGVDRPSAGKSPAPKPTADPPENPAPDLSVETFDGDTFSLAEQRGTPVVLNFWESW